LGDAASRVGANSIVGETKNSEARGRKVVLAKSVIAKGRAVAVERISIEFNCDSESLPLDEIVDSIFVFPDRYAVLWANMDCETEASSRFEHPDKKRVLQVGVG